MKRFLRLVCLACIACLGASAGVALAAPWQPAGDDVVVATLPQRSEAARAERALRRQWLAERHNLPLALATARRAIDTARRDGDPRALGQAQAALAPWWAHNEPPSAVRLLRAVVRQSLHDFDAARADFDALLREGITVPLELQAQARLSRASVLQVQGRLAEAEADCRALAGPVFAPLGAAAAMPAAACLAELTGLQGRPDAAAVALTRVADAAPAAYAGWIALMRAELAERRGEPAAEALFREAVRADASVYALGALADWLLAEGRPREVVALLDSRAEADALLLRLAIAQRDSGDARARATAAALRQRFDEARLRGESATHAREEARFALQVEGDAARALALAERNWQVQKEPADARVLMAAARAAARPEAAEPVRAHLRSTGLRDARLQGA